MLRHGMVSLPCLSYYSLIVTWSIILLPKILYVDQQILVLSTINYSNDENNFWGQERWLND